MGTAGDVNGDGYSDIIVPVAIENFGDRQRSTLARPGRAAPPVAAAICHIPIPGHDFMGGDLTAFLGGVGDATGDGLDDLVASTPENGSAYFFRSETAGTKTAFDFPSWKFSPGFGSSFAALFGTVRPIF